MSRLEALHLACESLMSEEFERAGPHGRGASEETRRLSQAQRVLWEIIEELEEQEG